MRGLGHDAQEALWQAHQGVGNLIQVAIKLERKLTVRWTLPRSRKLRETFKALVFARDGRFTCNNCGRVLTDDGLVQVDHIIPLGAPYFGTDTLDNMQILNPDCHAQKTYREATSAKMHV
jgi:5-methylcytosine-specific restriction endonuclease McrA